jgi:hypothetical protein
VADPAGLHFFTATATDAEDEAARLQLAEGGGLAGDDGGLGGAAVADADMDGQRVLQVERRGGVDQPVRAVAAVDCDVVSDV